MNTLYKALALFGLAMAFIVGGYNWGSSAKDNEWQARQAKAESAAHEAFRTEERRSFKASEEFQAAQQLQTSNYKQLEEAFHDYQKRKAPLARSRAVPASSAAAGQTEAAGCVVVLPESEPVLTHGALWMWNSALTGADTPSGTCGLADQSDEACSPETGLTFEDAWENHATNAKACAADRLRHQHLIDFLKGRLQ